MNLNFEPLLQRTREGHMITFGLSNQISYTTGNVGYI